MSGTSVLVVEDDARLREALNEQLREEGYAPRGASGVREAITALAGDPGLAVIDVSLPDGSGFELCRRIRDGGEGWDPGLPILFLSARTEEVDVLRGFERGGDDYLRKPFSMPELLARLRALEARGRRPAPRERVVLGPLEIDSGSRHAWWRGVELPLAGKEYELLLELSREPGTVRSKADLLRRVWGLPAGLRTRTLDSHASRLRRKLCAAGAPGDPIVNVWGRGYRLEVGE